MLSKSIDLVVFTEYGILACWTRCPGLQQLAGLAAHPHG